METSDRLIVSTQELLWERGYVGTSPKAIQRRAGVGQGSMYHHFKGKSDLAAQAVRKSGEQTRSEIEAILSGSGTAFTRISAYLRRERNVLRGCQIGGLTQDPEMMADVELRRPIEETLEWLQTRIAEVIKEGQDRGELVEELDPRIAASTIAAVLQGGYVLSRAAGSIEPFDQAIDGVLTLLSTQITAPS